jgi:hypothetical protein
MTSEAGIWSDVVLKEAPPLRDIGPFSAEDVFFGAPRSEAAFGGAQGLAQGPSFTAAERQRIEELIKAQLLENASQFSSKTAASIADVALADYHKVVDHQDHGRLLSKLGRVLSIRAVDEIKQMSFFDYVRDAFGPYELSDEENFGHEQICFRVVRPNRREDVGSLHRDAWFWDHFGFHVPAGVSRVKAWVPVCGASNEAGLLLAPGSHRVPGGFRTEMVDGKLKFTPEIDPQAVNLHRFLGNPGDPIMFNYGLLHVGALTRGESSRVSFEITIMFRSEFA